MNVVIRNALLEDQEAIRHIYNHYVRTSTATFDLEERTPEEQMAWFAHFGSDYPLIVAEREGSVIGYAGLMPFRSKPAYAHTLELTIYIEETARGGGVGRLLMKNILARGKQIQAHTVIAVITGDNQPSIDFHRRFGFTEVGCLREVGCKWGDWLDVCYFQLPLSTVDTYAPMVHVTSDKGQTIG